MAIFGGLAAILTFLCDIHTLAEFLSIGTLIAFSIVCMNVCILRYRQLDINTAGAATPQPKIVGDVSSNKWHEEYAQVPVHFPSLTNIRIGKGEAGRGYVRDERSRTVDSVAGGLGEAGVSTSTHTHARFSATGTSAYCRAGRLRSVRTRCGGSGAGGFRIPPCLLLVGRSPHPPLRSPRRRRPPRHDHPRPKYCLRHL